MPGLTLFRLQALVVIAVAIACVGIAIEKHILNTKREISVQQYRVERLQERVTRLKLRNAEAAAEALREHSQTDGEF